MEGVGRTCNPLFVIFTYFVKVHPLKCTLLYYRVYFMFRDMHVMVYFRYCPGCRNDVSEVVRAGEKLKDSKKKSKMASASSSSQRDWGKVSLPTHLRLKHDYCNMSFLRIKPTDFPSTFRVWPVRVALNSAPSCRPTTMAQCLVSQLGPSGSSGCRSVNLTLVASGSHQS